VCSASLITLVALVASMFTAAAAEDDGQPKKLMWVEKKHNIVHHQKRDVICQYTGWSVCPESVGGGCCPGGFACDASSCSSTSAAPSSACGLPNYYACGLYEGPGKMHLPE
jgi:hypothetical protein